MILMLVKNLGGICGMRNSSMKIFALMLVLIMVVGVGCSQASKPAEKEKPTLIMADAGWDSIRFHNDVVKIIVENGYGYKTDITPGSTPVTFEGVRKGDIDIYTEVWSDNIPSYPEAVKNGEVLELSVNFGDNMQGLYVPTYVIKGDEKRGIKALAPDLETINDLPKYWELFKDPEDKSKGRILGAIPGWAADAIMSEKVENYGLNKTYNLFRPGSDTALSTSIVQAYEKGEPWLGYYWEPTWIMGKYDMTLIKEPDFDNEKWDNGYVCQFPAVRVTVCVSKEMLNKAPEVVEFLKNYKTSSALTSAGLAYMMDNDVDTPEAAKWFLQNNKDLWTKWVPADVAKKVEAAIK